MGESYCELCPLFAGGALSREGQTAPPVRCRGSWACPKRATGGRPGATTATGKEEASL